MIEPKTKQIEVTTVQDMLVSTYGNKSAVASMLKINRGTLDSMLANKREHVVLIKGKEFKLLK